MGDTVAAQTVYTEEVLDLCRKWCGRFVGVFLEEKERPEKLRFSVDMTESTVE